VIQIQVGHNAWMRFRESDPNWEKFKKPSDNKSQTAFMQVCTPKKKKKFLKSCYCCHVCLPIHLWALGLCTWKTLIVFVEKERKYCTKIHLLHGKTKPTIKKYPQQL
jgi:hypothetical protein